MTNFEKIKTMSTEELADFICGLADCRCCPIYCSDRTCKCSWVEWLKSEVKNEQ